MDSGNHPQNYGRKIQVSKLLIVMVICPEVYEPMKTPSIIQVKSQMFDEWVTFSRTDGDQGTFHGGRRSRFGMRGLTPHAAPWC